jgi:hypothetical protein
MNTKEKQNIAFEMIRILMEKTEADNDRLEITKWMVQIMEVLNSKAK